MKRAIAVFVTSVLLFLVLAPSAYVLAAGPDGAGTAGTGTAGAGTAGAVEGFLIDDMSDSAEWSSVGGDTSLVRYGSENEYLSSGEDDDGYIAVRRYGTKPGEPLELSRSFAEPVDLYEWDRIGFYINITDVGVPGAEYNVTVTLYSRGPSYSSGGKCEAGGWVRFTAETGGYSLRTDIVGISVSVAVTLPEKDAPETVRVSYRVDDMRAEGKRDTSHEARFLAPSLEARGGVPERAEDGSYSVTAADGRARFTGQLVIRRRRYAENDLFRFTVTTDGSAELTLTVSYVGGLEDAVSNTVRITGGGVPTAVYFDIDNIDLVYTYTLTATGEGPVTLRFYGAETVRLPDERTPGIGSLEVCRAARDGSVNLRGTVPPSSVADYIDGDIGIYCIPLYEDAEEYIKEAEPVAVLDVSTRFDVTVGADALPTGYIAMRFLAVIRRGDERVPVAQPKLPTFSEEAGTALPARRAGIKGIASADPAASAAAGASTVVIDADLDELFGSASSGRLYSYGGRIMYFDNDAISDLDAAIKTPSLTGSACFLHLRFTSPRGGYRAVTVDDADEFSTLAAAVTYLSQRYSSPDYGFISGIILGDTVYTDKNSGVSAAERAEAEAKALAVTYQIGRSYIAGFSVMVPVGDRIAYPNSNFDAATLLGRMAYSMDEYGVPYGIYMSSGDPLPLADAFRAFASMLGKNAPTSFYAEYVPTEPEYSPTLLSEYAEQYRRAAADGSLSGLLLSAPSGHDGAFCGAFSLLDTSEYGAASEYMGVAEADVPEASLPVEAARVSAYASDPGISGSYTLFDFSDSYDTAGWFPVAGAGECSTAGKLGERALRILGAEGAMWSSATSPRDLSRSPYIALTASAAVQGRASFTVYSAGGICTAELTLGSSPRTFYIDLSGFSGVDSVTGFALTSEAGVEILVRSVALGSAELTDGELTALFSSAADGGADGGETEGGFLRIMAIALVSLAFGVSAFGVIRRRRVGGMRDEAETQAIGTVGTTGAVGAAGAAGSPEARRQYAAARNTRGVRNT